MIPSMHAYGGWSGLVGDGDLVGLGSKTLKELGLGKQLFADTATREYASLLRDPKDGKDFGALTTIDPSTPFSVALIGGGIANVIAAYELSRCGVRVTLFESEKTLGGRMYAEPPGEAAAPAPEFGATRFPAESRLIWHYVRAWAAYMCQGTQLDPDSIQSKVYPDPGVVPTMGCYQNTWFRLTADPGQLPAAARTAARMWISFLTDLNDGMPEPSTKYLKDAQEAARRDDWGDQWILYQFWQAMRRRYENKSLGEVLRTEVFALRGGDIPNLVHAFGAIGVGTGGFGPLFDVGFLEVLRNIVWNTTGNYLLPSQSEYPVLYPQGVNGTGAFVDGLAHLAHASGGTSRAFTDMFRTSSTVVGVTVKQVDGRPDQVVVAYNGKTEAFDFAIVAMSTRGMQAIGLDKDAPGGPFSRLQPHTEDSLRAVEGIQDALHNLNMVPASRTVVEVKAPAEIPEWPRSGDGSPITCFVTDRYAQVTSFMPQNGAVTRTQAVATALGNEGLKFEVFLTGDDDRERIASSFDPEQAGPNGTHVVVGSTLRDGRVKRREWNLVPGFGGGFKLDLPGQTYLSGCLFYHSLLAGAESEPTVRPYSRVFLAGDSVGFLGGWAEGSAMSALNAVTAVLVQCEKQSGKALRIRSRELVTRNERQGFGWTHLSIKQPELPRLKSSTWLVDCSQDQRKPGTWRYDGAEVSDFTKVAVSQDGGQMIGTTPDGMVLHRLFNHTNPVRWEPFRGLRYQMKPGPVDIAISCGSAEGSPGVGVAQLLALSSRFALFHCQRVSDTAWTEWERVNESADGPVMIALRCAIAAAGRTQRAYVAVAQNNDAAKWSMRNTDGTWQDFEYISGAGMAEDVAVALPAGYDQDHPVFGWIDDVGFAYLARRTADGHWEPEMQLPRPVDVSGQTRGINRLSLVSNAPGTGRVLALGGDRNAYQCAFDLTTRTSTRWRPVPFPHGTPYQVTDLSLGNSVDWRDPAGSVTVWSLGDPPQDADEE